MGIRSLPAMLGAEAAARVACWVMALPQVVVVVLLLIWGGSIEAAILVMLLAGQFLTMQRFLDAPTERAIWYSGFGVPLYVFGMLASAFALRGLVA